MVHVVFDLGSLGSDRTIFDIMFLGVQFARLPVRGCQLPGAGRVSLDVDPGAIATLGCFAEFGRLHDINDLGVGFTNWIDKAFPL